VILKCPPHSISILSCHGFGGGEGCVETAGGLFEIGSSEACERKGEEQVRNSAMSRYPTFNKAFFEHRNFKGIVIELRRSGSLKRVESIGIASWILSNTEVAGSCFKTF